MKIPKNTPGPWKVNHEDDLKYCVVKENGIVFHDIAIKIHFIQDANLIAAAPDLLHIVEKTRYLIESLLINELSASAAIDLNFAHSQILKVIAKAKGEECK